MTTAGEEAEGGVEDLEPLFDYKRVQPAVNFLFDDSDLEKADIFKHCNKRPRVDAPDKAGEKAADAVEKPKVVEVDEEDWLLPPPPKAAFRPPAEEDSALRELRLKKQELAQFAGSSAQEFLQKLDEMARKDVGAKETPEHIILDEESEPQVEKAREKIVLSIQDKNGQQQFRVYKDEKFEKIFKAYAKKVKLDPSNLTFVFDGEKITPSCTPADHGLEDDDMIEVCYKRH